MIFGILCGLAAAFTQSFSYLATRHVVQRRGPRGMWDLLILGHILMGIMGLVGCIAVWPAHSGDIRHWGILWPLLGTCGFYLIGQAGLQYSLKHGEASRITLPPYSLTVLRWPGPRRSRARASGGARALGAQRDPR